LKAAAHAQLVPDADLKGLTTRMHLSRGGALEPYGDDRDVPSQTKQGLDQVVRERAYFLWEQEGCPEGRADESVHIASAGGSGCGERSQMSTLTAQNRKPGRDDRDFVGLLLATAAIFLASVIGGVFR